MISCTGSARVKIYVDWRSQIRVLILLIDRLHNPMPTHCVCVCLCLRVSVGMCLCIRISVCVCVCVSDRGRDAIENRIAPIAVHTIRINKYIHVICFKNTFAHSVVRAGHMVFGHASGMGRWDYGRAASIIYTCSSAWRLFYNYSFVRLSYCPKGGSRIRDYYVREKPNWISFVL